MSLRKVLSAVVAVAALSLLVAASVSARGVALKPVSFQSNGAYINGWYWVRSPGQTATWTFDAAALQAARPASVNLNLAALVTNGVSGGSGYSTTVRASVSNGVRTRTTGIYLTNPFRPTDPEDSGGIGYQAYGHAYLSSSVWKGATTITVTISYPTTRGYHVAVNRDALLIGYSVTG
ncbi:MAG TPA: hypothetical protein VF379_07420 [Gaiellaceae bacterium]